MPTKTKKKTARPTTAKRKVTAKAAPKAAKAKKVAPAPVEKRTGFMWKLLEQKEAALKAREAQGKAGNGGHFERIHANGGDVYARFNGPRRKAA